MKNPEEEKLTRRLVREAGQREKLARSRGAEGCPHELKRDAVLGGQYCVKCFTNFQTVEN